MEFERTLFRIHERFLSIDAVNHSVNICYRLSILVILICLPVFFYGNYTYLNQSPCLKPLIDKDYILDPDYQRNETNLSDPTKKFIRKDDLVILKLADLTKENIDVNNDKDLMLLFEFSGIPQVLYMDTKIRTKHNYTTYNITIDSNCYASSIFKKGLMLMLDYETVLINEMVMTFEGFNRYIKNNFTSEPWSFSNTHYESIIKRENIFVRTFSRVFEILKLLLGLFLVSNITAIYNKVTIICAPIFILATYRLCARQTAADRIHLYRVFPWLGMYLYTLNVNGRKNDKLIIFSFFCLIIIFYCLYLAAVVFWNLLLFSKSFPKGLDENFYGFFALLEFLALLFVRTRSSIKFIPKMTIVTVLMFLCYVQYTPYGFYHLALFIMTWTCFGILAYFLKTFEIPGANEWNASFHYTPSNDSPRTLYSPIFSLTWYHDIPQLWTMFYPLYGRSYFTNSELAMVDRNYPLLMSTLQTAGQRGDQQEGNEGQGNLNNNNLEFALQELGNGFQNEENVEEGNNSPSRANNPNLLQNADSDVVLDMSNAMGGGNNRNENNRGDQSAEESSGHRYRRINEP